MSISVEHIHVTGWEAAIRGMRNPMNSWAKSDSAFSSCSTDEYMTITGTVVDKPGGTAVYGEFNDPACVGPNDMALMQRLAADGPVHGKFLRMLTVTMDITAPLYWWKEFDTYKVGTVANSCSTMHKIQAKEFTMDDFSIDHLISCKDNNCDETESSIDISFESTTVDPEFDHSITTEIALELYPKEIFECVIDSLNTARKKFIETGDKRYWWQMIQLLPSSYNQRRTVQMNYQVVKEILEYRSLHKLDEWREFCKILMSNLPLSRELLSPERLNFQQKQKE